MTIEQAVYIACCIVGFVSILGLRAGRHRHASDLLGGAYIVLAFGLGYEGAEAYVYGSPAFPAGRWFVVPPLAVVLAAAAFKDWREHRIDILSR